MPRLITSLLATALVVAAGPSPGAAAVPDHDGDGVAGAADCKPLDPTIFPGAPDKPDLAFVDSNCDGIDGSAADAFFVSVSGSSGGLGTRAIPFNSIQAGLDAAAATTPAKDVYVTGGNFGQALAAADGVGIYGGYEPATWTRAAANVTTVTGAPQALLADDDQGVVVQMLTLQGGAGTPSSYGLRAVNGSTLFLSDVKAVGGTAANGANGSPGLPGAPGVSGLNGGPGCTPGPMRFGPGGSGGTGGFGGNGGAGFVGVSGGTVGSAVGGAGGGLAGAPSGVGGNGQPGHHGPHGQNNASTLPDTAGWQTPSAAMGLAGGAGAGGGGGKGGTGTTFLGIGVCGGGGGSGGTGGGGGGAGTGGQNGGGSFGVYVVNAGVTVSESVLTGGAGGKGGNGGAGGFGGAGGARGLGGPGSCLNSCGQPGANGGPGGDGGRGGGGGAGVGGPSAAVYQAGTGSRFVAVDSTLTHGSAGTGGIQGNTGLVAASGAAAELLRSPTAPATPGDYDGDTVLDDVDACPTLASGSFDINPADGCPDDRVRPVLVLGGSAKQRMLATRAVAFTAKTGEGCSLTATAKLGRKKLGSLSARTLPADTNRSYKIKLGAADLKAIRSALGRRGADDVKLAVACVDPAGNRGTASKRIRIVR